METVRSANPPGVPGAGDPRLAAALERSGLAVLLLDAQGVVRRATRGLARVLGLDPQEVLGQHRLAWWLGLSVLAGSGGHADDGRSRLTPAQADLLSRSVPHGADVLDAVRAGVPAAQLLLGRAEVAA